MEEMQSSSWGNPQESSATLPAQRPRNRRLQRIRDYRNQVLDRAEPLQANLGAASSDLMWIEYYLSRDIRRAMASIACPTENLSFLMPSLQVLLQITRQIDRFSRLEQCLDTAATTRSTATRSALDRSDEENDA